MRKSLTAIALCLTLGTVSAATPFWGARQSLPAGTPVEAIHDGEFIWNPKAAGEGPVAVVVSLTEQRVYAYRNGVEIGVSSASTGKHGHETPTGVFVTLQKDKDHRSSLYNSAPMPYTQRLTWDGIALHAGGLPGFPSSHGCVHLPSEFARLLFDAAPKGMTVVIANERSAPQSVAHPGLLLPVDLESGEPLPKMTLAAGEEERWEPEQSVEGPLSLVVSSRDRRLVVLRNGVEIGRARLDVDTPDLPLGTHVYIAGEHAPGDSVPWHAIAVKGHETPAEHTLDVNSVARVSLPDGFADKLRPLVEPGTTLLVTDGAISSDTHAVQLELVNAEPHDEAPRS